MQGDCGTVFGGEICTWAKMQGDELIKFGASIPLAVAENAELEGEFVFPPVFFARISLPNEVKEKTGIDHLGVNWEVHGHPPGPFLTPHFDFHFYTPSRADVDAIDCSDITKPDIVPAGYSLPDMDIPELGLLVGLCVPQMGMHALADEEMNATDLFGGSMVIGYYARETIFIEPMIARDKLLARESFPLEIPGLTPLGEGLSWPAGFEAVYDDQADSYQFVYSMVSAD